MPKCFLCATQPHMKKYLDILEASTSMHLKLWHASIKMLNMLEYQCSQCKKVLRFHLPWRGSKSDRLKKSLGTELSYLSILIWMFFENLGTCEFLMKAASLDFYPSFQFSLKRSLIIPSSSLCLDFFSNPFHLVFCSGAWAINLQGSLNYGLLW